jgi:N-formylglutamate amidohydrolase
MTDGALLRPDTDWHVSRLYDFVRDMEVSVLEANYSRYYIDVNRSAQDEKLYPGESETELCPRTTFDDCDIYASGRGPTGEEIHQRLDMVWQPYHEALSGELERIKSEFGYAMLWDAHSIRCQVPRFFSGQLPDFNLGTNDGRSCPAELAHQLFHLVSSHHEYNAVLDGRFKGGYITRQYGDPANCCYAVQLELSQRTYMNEETYEYRSNQAAAIIPIITEMISAMLAFAPVSK